MAALIYVAFMVLVATFSPAIAGTKPIVCKYKGPHLFSLPRLFQPHLGKPDLPQRSLSRHLPEQASKRRIPTAGPFGRSSIKILIAVFARVNGPISLAIRLGTDGEPSRSNWFGTNQRGPRCLRPNGPRHAASRCCVGFVSMGIAAAIGITFGAAAGYFGGWVDMLVSRLIEVRDVHSRRSY